MKILHILRDMKDAVALDTIRTHAESDDVSILLIQDAVLEDGLGLNAKIYALLDDVEKRGVETQASTVTYTEVVDLIVACDRVISW
jgi:sulfur relay protein TusB/DsrH